MAVGTNYTGYGNNQAAQPGGGLQSTQQMWGPTPNQTGAQEAATKALGLGVDIMGPQAVNPQLASVLGAYQPQFALAEAQANQALLPYQAQLGLIPQETGLQQSQAQQEAGFSQQQLALQGQQLGIQQGALARQMALLPQQYGLQQQGFGLSETQAQQGYQQQLRGLNSAETAAGAYTSTGANQSRGDLYNNLVNNLQGIGLQRQGAALTFQEQQAQQQDAQKQLDIQSKQLGISGDEIRARLQNTLQQLGISNYMSVDQVLQQMGQIQQGEVTPLSGLMGTISSLTGVTTPGSNAASYNAF